MMPDIEIKDSVKWQKVKSVQRIMACRTGWVGAWDAFVAALLRRPRLEVARDLTISALVTMPPEGKMEFIASQAEWPSGMVGSAEL